MKKTISPDHQKKLAELGCFLHELRINEGISQTDLCNKLNLHPNTIGRIENGQNTTLITLLKLSEFLETPLNEFLENLE